MHTHLRNALTAVLFSIPLFAGEAYLPLQAGNTWTYRMQGGSDTFTIRVGTPIMSNDTVYYRLFGYTPKALWVRADKNNNLYYLDEDAEQDRPLTSFEYARGAWFQANARQCEQEGQVDEEHTDWAGPVGWFPSTLTIHYRSHGCADVGVESERYAANIGMMERTVTTFAGPRTYELVSAHVGSLDIRSGAKGNFNVSVRLADAEPKAIATLELRTDNPVLLKDLSIVEVDVQLRTPDGHVIWRSTDGVASPPAVRDASLMVRSWDVEIPLASWNGNGFPDGQYQVEAWVNSGENRVQFAAVAPLVLVTAESKKR